MRSMSKTALVFLVRYRFVVVLTKCPTILRRTPSRYEPQETRMQIGLSMMDCFAPISLSLYSMSKHKCSNEYDGNLFLVQIEMISVSHDSVNNRST